MLTLNGKKFARNKAEFDSSLFHPGGTCAGYYKANSDHIVLLDPKKQRIGVIKQDCTLVKATKRGRGYWYNFGTIPEIGEFPGYSQEINEIQAALSHCGLTKTYSI